MARWLSDYIEGKEPNGSQTKQEKTVREDFKSRQGQLEDGANIYEWIKSFESKVLPASRTPSHKVQRAETGASRTGTSSAMTAPLSMAARQPIMSNIISNLRQKQENRKATKLDDQKARARAMFTDLDKYIKERQKILADEIVRERDNKVDSWIRDLEAPQRRRGPSRGVGA